MKHCDDFIDDESQPACLRAYLAFNRAPAVKQFAMVAAKDPAADPALFATFQGKRVRVVMASRMGDVGVTSRLEDERGYTQRVMVEELSDLSEVA